jgi:outer membrane protein assembly factor BamB
VRQLLATPILALALIVALGSTALADPVPASMFGGTYFAMSEDHTAVAFKMADGHLRWEVNGVPISNYGVDDVARAASIGYDNATVLVLYGRIRGTYFGASQDGSVMGFLMPDGTTRWELNGVPAGAR